MLINCQLAGYQPVTYRLLTGHHFLNQTVCCRIDRNRCFQQLKTVSKTQKQTASALCPFQLSKQLPVVRETSKTACQGMAFALYGVHLTMSDTQLSYFLTNSYKADRVLKILSILVFFHFQIPAVHVKQL